MATRPQNWEAIKALFEAALEEDSARRSSFLQERCADPSLRAEVERLLAEHEQAGSFLSTPALDDFPVQASRPSQRLQADEVLAGRFRIVHFVAAGGMGEVYEAEDQELRERVAIKIIRPEILNQPNAVTRFKREVHLARKVTHSNVCRIFDLFRHKSEGGSGQEEIVFLSMELLHGKTLGEQLKAGRLDEGEALPLVEQMASALAAAHGVGIVHRDFKPGNVMLVGASGQWRAVVTDFGLALRSLTADEGASHSTGQTFLGTPAYMSPEQLEGRPATPASDIYALGLVMYEMVTGARPFQGDTPISAALKRLTEMPAPPRRFQPGLSGVWESVILRCLERDPAQRFASAVLVTGALTSGEPPLLSTIAARKGAIPQEKALESPGGKVWKIALPVLLVILLVAGNLYYLPHWLGKGHATSVHAAMRPTVAVLGFKNLSGNTDVAWISPALSQMLGTELTAGEELRLIPSEQVTHGKIDLFLTDEDSLGRDSLTRVRNNIGSDFVVVGSFLDMKGQIRIDFSLQNAVSGKTVANMSVSGTEQNLPELAIRAGEGLRRKLGVAAPSTDDNAHIKASQSTSLEATRLYSEALQKLHSFDSVAARDLLERAIVEDPNYALAHSALAEAWRSLGYAARSANEAKKAMDLSASLSRENRLAIEAQYRNTTHEIAREIEIYKTLFNFYPDNLEYGFSLAKSQYSNAQFQEADATLDALQQLPPPQGDDPRIDFARSAVAIKTGDYKKALTLAERVELRAQQRGARRMVAQALSNQCILQSRLGNPARATAACDRSRAIFSDVGDLAAEAGVWGQIAFEAGATKSGKTANERQIVLLKKVESDGQLAWAMTVGGELSADIGDYRRAIGEYNEALKLYQKISDQSGVSTTHGNLGWVNYLQGNLTDATRNFEQAISLMRGTASKGETDLWLELLAEVSLEKGDVSGATEQLEEGFKINTETGDKRVGIYLHTARSRLLLAQGELNESRREAELVIKSCLEVSDESGADGGQLLLARLDIAENHFQTATEVLRKALSDSKIKQEEARQIEARALLVEALLAMPSHESKREVALLSRIAPNTQTASLRLGANLQIARARFALGDRVGALQLLEEVISESDHLGYEAGWLEARLARAEMDLQSGASSAGRAEIERLAKRAQAMGLKLIANKAQSLLKKELSLGLLPSVMHRSDLELLGGPQSRLALHWAVALTERFERKCWSILQKKGPKDGSCEC
jgi:eukaryotic-like serine/threonine-protein kinase